MEAYPSPPSASNGMMIDMPMGQQMQIHQPPQTQQSISITPERCYLEYRPATENYDYPEKFQNVREANNAIEEKEDENEDQEELLFDIDEFLVEEETLLSGNNDGENGGAMIIAESPTNTNTNSNPSTVYSKATDETTGNDTIYRATNDNIESSNGNNSSSINKKKRKRRSRSRTKSKSVEGSCVPPKRPLSAYNLYFREERKRCIAEANVDTLSCNISNSQQQQEGEGTATKTLTKKKKYNFEELGKLIGKGWRNLPKKAKRELEARAETDRERYRIEMIAYRREKRRKDLEEDEDTLILMRNNHRQNISKSPTLTIRSTISVQGMQAMSQEQQHQHITYSPKRSDDPCRSELRRHITESPGRPQAYHSVQQQKQGHPRDKPNHYPVHVADDDSRQINHARTVSLSISSPPYPGSASYRSRNNSSPSASSSGSCSSWSGSDYEEENMNKHSITRKYENDEENSKGRVTLGSESRSDNSSTGTSNSSALPTEAVLVDHPPKPQSVPQSHQQVPRLENGPHRSPVSSPRGVAVARVVVMPSTAGLQQILEDGRRSASLSPPPPSGLVRMHPYRPQPPQPRGTWVPHGQVYPPQHIYHQSQHSHHQPYPPPSPQRAIASPPPPPLSINLSQHPHHYQPQHPEHMHHYQHRHRQEEDQPRMLPSGMEIFLRDPNTGQERSYRVQYTPKQMSAEQARQFQQTQGGFQPVMGQPPIPTARYGSQRVVCHSPKGNPIERASDPPRRG